MREVRFSPLEPDDLLAIEQQPSQRTWMGAPCEIDHENALLLAAQPVAWTARRADGSILACFGIHETFDDLLGRGVQGVAWAMLSSPVGKDHLALTRFMRRQVEAAGLQRIELIAKAVDVESFRDFALREGFPVDTAMLVRASMTEPTPECRWAVMLGFEPAHVLRKFGGASETYMLFERIA
jgi:hypothetical protein